MKKGFIIGTIIALIGVIMTVVAISIGGLSVFNSSGSIVEQKYTYNDFDQMKIETGNWPVYIERSIDDNVHVITYENEKTYFEIVDGKDIEIKLYDNEKILDNINIGIGNDEVYLVVQIPENCNGDIYIENTNGRVKVNNVDVNSLNINNKNSLINLNNVNINTGLDLNVENSMIKMNNVSSNSDILLNTKNGIIEANNVTGNNILLETDTGKIELDRVNASGDLSVTSNTGKVDIDDSFIDGSLYVDTKTSIIDIDDVNYNNEAIIQSKTGQIEVNLPDRSSNYTYNLVSNSGLIAIDDNDREHIHRNQYKQQGGQKLLQITTDNGRINVEFD